LVEARIVLHCLQIGGAQSKLFLLGALGVVLGVVFGVVLGVVLGIVLGVVLEVARRVVLVGVCLFRSAGSVTRTHASGS